MEILRADIGDFIKIAVHLGTSISMLGEKDIWGDEEHLAMLELSLEELRGICQEGELPVTQKLVDDILTTFKLVRNSENETVKSLLMRDHSSDMLRHKLFTLRDRFQDELSTKLFLQVPPSKKRYFDTPLAGWKEIVDRFPKCTRDVEEMNRCFSLSRYTASMFHAMHIAEWGAIEMGNYIGVSDPKRGWAPTQKRLRELIKGGRTSLPTNLSDKFEFLEQMDREVHSMMLAWRHKIDHAANHLAILPNTDFTPDVAEHIIMSVRVFMKRLLDGIQSEQ